LELVGEFFMIYAYYDNNNVPGFQYNLGDGIDCLTAPSGADCIDITSLQDLSTGVSWGPITVNQLACPAGYNGNCTVRVSV